jgi:hypothetical protein
MDVIRIDADKGRASIGGKNGRETMLEEGRHGRRAATVRYRELDSRLSQVKQGPKLLRPTASFAAPK